MKYFSTLIHHHDGPIARVQYADLVAATNIVITVISIVTINVVK